LTLQDFDRPIRILSEEGISKFLAALGKKWLHLAGRLMGEGGLRREEAAGLTIHVLPDFTSFGSGDWVRMNLDPELTPTKGSKFRWVELPTNLAAELFQYKTVVRPRLADLYRLRHGKDPDELFLTRYGDPVSLKGVNNRFTRASKKTGVKCSPHVLRHTWATLSLLRKLDEGLGPSLALFWLRDRMGHVSIATTQRYVHLLWEAGQETLLRHQEGIMAMLAREGA
jgi:integrase